jgi:hypothetical protein
MRIFASSLVIAAAVVMPRAAFAQSAPAAAPASVSQAPMHTVEQAKPLPLPLSQTAAAPAKATSTPASQPDKLVPLPAAGSSTSTPMAAPAKSSAQVATPARLLPPLKLQDAPAPKAVRDTTHG